MNMKDLEKEYIDMTDSTMPDMEKLWERISSTDSEDDDISAFESASQHTSSRKNISLIRVISSVAAVFTVVFCLSIMKNSNSDKMIAGSSPAADDSGYADNCPDAADNSCEAAADAYESEPMQIKSVSGWEYSEYSSDSLSYNTLNLADTESGIYTALSRNNEENEFFVEEAVLSETEYFLDCRIISSEVFTEDTICYTVVPIHIISDNEMALPVQMNIYSSSPYTLRTGREYLIPVHNENGLPVIVFDNAPQIEISEDRELICHNGWHSLTHNSTYIEYPQVYKDDYFFDRMTLTAESSISDLIESWRQTR